MDRQKWAIDRNKWAVSRYRRPALSEVQRKLFVEHLLRGDRLTQAARAVGYHTDTKGHRYYHLVHDKVVRREIDRHMRKMEIKADEVLGELRDIALAEWADFPEHMVQFHGKKVPRIVLADKVKALELLARYLGLFNKDESQRPQVNVGLFNLQQVLTMTPEEASVLESLTQRTKLLGEGAGINIIEEAGPLEHPVHSVEDNADIIEGDFSAGEAGA